jgi:hypothetical protein
VREFGFDHQGWANVEELVAYCRSVIGVHRLLAAGRPEITELLGILDREIRRLVRREPFLWLWS